MAGIGIKFLNLSEFERSLKGAKDTLDNAIAAALYQFGNNIMTEAKEKAPVDLGTLRGSGYVTLPEKTASGPVVELGFGGHAESYAVIMHEVHPTRSKFLENALNEATASAQRDLASLVDANMREGLGAPPQGPNITDPKQGPDLRKKRI
jgi:hypothetical protein